MIIALIISSVVCMVIGILIGFSALDYNAKKEFRQRIEGEAGKPGGPAGKFMESRKEKRGPVNYPEVLVRAPVVDSAGVADARETMQFSAVMINVSRHGMAIISHQFLPVGLDIEITCRDPKYRFPFQRAEVKHVNVMAKGLKIGLQMFEAIDIN